MSFNSIGFSVLGLPAYFFCAGAGFVIAAGVFIILLHTKKHPLNENLKILAVSVAAMAVTARLFGALSGIYRAVGAGEKITAGSILETGIVFYGGLFGLLGTYYLLAKRKKLDTGAMDILAVVIPLFHCAARIGCFLAGCCFGVECDCFLGVRYTTVIQSVENTARRLPVQLLESGFNLLLFAYLLYLLCRDDWKKKHILRTYLLIYSAGRFVLEFFRGDEVRGVLWGISFSQAISIIIWLLLIGYEISGIRKRETGRNHLWKS